MSFIKSAVGITAYTLALTVKALIFNATSQLVIYYITVGIDTHRLAVLRNLPLYNGKEVF